MANAKGRAAAVAGLTAQQLACLRLVYRHLQTKDIARELGLSPYTVDTYIREAIRKLGVATRKQAALIVAQSDAGAGSEWLGPQSLELAPDASSGTLADMDPAGGREPGRAERRYPTADERDDRAAVMLGEAVATFDRTPFPAAKGPPLRLWGGRNDLTTSQRLGVGVGLAIGMALAFGAIVGSLAALRNFF